MSISAPERSTFYVTTPIYYINARPHVGSLYSTVLADVAARWHTMRGQDVFFLTGADEHGQKVAQAAEKAGMQPQAFVDSLVGAFKKTWHDYHIDYSKFIRTTDDYHIRAVQQWLQRLINTGDIYKSYYEGWYCSSAEAFLTDKDIDMTQKYTKENPPVSPHSGKPAQWISEECYFFKLSAYQDKLLKFYEENPNFIAPKERAAEVINFVKSGLKDLSISRTTIKWGIPFPGDAKHVAYVWADALNNYITAIGYGDPSAEEEFKKWWPADLHILGKDIVRFHAIYWPAFLIASDLPLPRKLLVHGWIKMDNQKMSKSLGNVVDPEELIKTYDPDVVRYYLTRYMAITQDSSFSYSDLQEKNNADCANSLGNLLNRVSALAHKYEYTNVIGVHAWTEAEKTLQKALQNTIEAMDSHMQKGYFSRAYEALFAFVRDVNGYVHAQEPWKIVKTDREKFERVIAATCHSLYAIALLLWPVMPKKMEHLVRALGANVPKQNDTVARLDVAAWDQNFVIQKTDPLFVKFEAEKKKQEKNVKMSEEKKDKKTENYASFEDFVKVEVATGTIKNVEPIEKSDKLYKLTVDCGSYGVRTICAGIKKYYAPEELLDKQAVFAVNLKPRKLLGVESQGMIMLAQDSDGKPQLVSPVKEVPNGTRLK